MQHHRTYDHRSLENCSTVHLDGDVGRYPSGTLLCEVLDDIVLRISRLQADYATGFSVAPLNAWLSPAHGIGASGYVMLESVVSAPISASSSLDAHLVAPTPITRSASLGVNAVVLAQTVPTAQLAAAIDATQTTITVTSASGFPTSGDYLIQIGTETMLVTGGQGTTTWTVARTAGTPHAAGSILVAC